MAAASIAVSVSMGAMKPLLEKLATLMGDKYKKLKGLRKEVNFLMCELADMKNLLERMDSADELDPQAKNWRKDIIDMSYDIEDYIDDFMSRVGQAGDEVGILQKASHSLKTFKDRYRIANQIKKIKAKVIQASERRKRYMLDQSIFSTSPVTVDPRLSTLYVESASLVGIDSQKKEIVRWAITNEEQELKVMSIVGFGGLGKTTLANEVYREVGGKFSCKAFVSVSQKPDIIKLLNSLRLQLGLQPYSHDCELQDLINSIREHLQGMRDKEGEMTVMANNRPLSQVRSLSIFGGNCRIPNLLEFKFMRVLFLDVSSLKTTTDLTGINHLSQLRYLRVENGHGNKVLLPAQIRGLRFLETLDLSEVSCVDCWAEIVDVPQLSHVSVNWPERVRLPDGINKVKSLLTLIGFDLGMSSIESITGLGELTALSELFLLYKGEKMDNNGGVVTLIAALVTSLKKLGNLKKLGLCNISSKVYSGDALLESSFSPPFCNIERLYVNILIFSSFPRWIGHLRCLRKLRLNVKQMDQEDFDIIGIKLTSLVQLNLLVVRIPTERIMIGRSTGFKVLRSFDFDCDGVSCLTFEAGAMPDLRELHLWFNPREWDKATPAGLQHLPSLKKIRVIPMKLRSDTRPFEKKDAQMMKCVFQEAAGALPTGPAVEVKGYSLPRKEEVRT
ncbi:hypothetical protein EJB05_10281 [Eragrostis curvula]|uniref:Rx N-terminal domain-containing protein n=1 Tax=Eragrostis curvula TaxID=38414 RepID=A0A5J9W755_9POAL|nr:hypothetical protein EJB05_10281 [Eragrostis curvula]